MPTNLSASANLSVPLTQSYSSGGSINSGQSGSWSNNNSNSTTNAEAARIWSAEQARIAFERQKELMQMEQAYNAEQAKISRDWEESMANTIYTRSVKNMREAGINPILAANIGLSGASVGSGATASISGASAPMAQSFMDTSSASSGASQSWGENHGSSWSDSEGGIITALSALGELFEQLANQAASSQTINILLDGLETSGLSVGKSTTDKVKEAAGLDVPEKSTKDKLKEFGKSIIKGIIGGPIIG